MSRSGTRMLFLVHATRRMFGRASIVALLAGGWSAAVVFSVHTSAWQAAPAPPRAPSAAPQAVFSQYCFTCHNSKLRTAGLALDTLDATNAGANAGVWERVIEKLRAGAMPPPGRPRPDPATAHAVARWLETEIDRAWTANPKPGRIN